MAASCKSKTTLNCPAHTGAAYFFWISVDDFASIMGMSVEKVEDDGVYLRMK